VIAWQHLRRPVSRSLESQIDPPPVFETVIEGADRQNERSGEEGVAR
jgi:hypothetical protein